jgi:hypothetical protein
LAWEGLTWALAALELATVVPWDPRSAIAGRATGAGALPLAAEGSEGVAAASSAVGPAGTSCIDSRIACTEQDNNKTHVTLPTAGCVLHNTNTRTAARNSSCTYLHEHDVLQLLQAGDSSHPAAALQDALDGAHVSIEIT